MTSREESIEYDVQNVVDLLEDYRKDYKEEVLRKAIKRINQEEKAKLN